MRAWSPIATVLSNLPLPKEAVEFAEPLIVPSLLTLKLSDSIVNGLFPAIVVASTLPNEAVEVAEPLIVLPINK